jgi:bifunctional DNA-binding transcriptional regulator/antitoxin component of YhaV-PrlF toxin-antitoxin module
MIKIKSYTIKKRREGNITITIPKVWTSDHDLENGDHLEIFRDDKDHLIITASKRKRN